MTTTPQDLLIVAMDPETGHPVERVEQGDLSLALAGAEVIDLLAAGAVSLDGDRIVPGPKPAPADRLPAAAAAAVIPQEPYESVSDWLWRRGRGLSAVYQAALEADGDLVRERRRGLRFGAGQRPPVPSDSPARSRAADRLASDEPVLAALAEAVGVRGDRTGDIPDVADEAVGTVLAAVNEAVVELGSVRQRRAIDEAAFDNIWRAV